MGGDEEPRKVEERDKMISQTNIKVRGKISEIKDLKLSRD